MCLADSDCEQPYFVCSENMCLHKGIFPMYLPEFLGFLILPALVGPCSKMGFLDTIARPKSVNLAWTVGVMMYPAIDVANSVLSLTPFSEATLVPSLLSVCVSANGGRLPSGSQNEPILMNPGPGHTVDASFATESGLKLCPFCLLRMVF